MSTQDMIRKYTCAHTLPSLIPSEQESSTETKDSKLNTEVGSLRQTLRNIYSEAVKLGYTVSVGDFPVEILKGGGVESEKTGVQVSCAVAQAAASVVDNEEKLEEKYNEPISEEQWYDAAAHYETEALVEAQKADTMFGPIRTWLEALKGDKDALFDSKNVRKSFAFRIRKTIEHYVIGPDGRLWFNESIVADQSITKRSKLCIPVSRVEQLLDSFHAVGHFGVEKTQFSIRQRFFWWNMCHDIKTYSDACSLCQQKRGRPGEFGKMQPVMAQGRAMLVSCDHTGPLEETVEGFKHILVFTDHFSRCVELVPVRDVSAETTARAFIDHVCLRWGIPYRLLTDQGSGFTADAFRAMCQMLGVNKIFTTSHHPQTNGKTERFNKTMNEVLSKLVDSTLRNWAERLPAVQWAYNTVTHPATGYAPHFLRYGFEPRLPADLQYELTIDQYVPETVKESIRVMDEAYTAALDAANEHASKTATQAEMMYNEKHKDPDAYFQVGKKVWFYAAPIGGVHKLLLPWIGPFIISQVVTPQTFRLQDVNTKLIMDQLVSCRRMKPFIPKFRPIGAPELLADLDVFDLG